MEDNKSSSLVLSDQIHVRSCDMRVEPQCALEIFSLVEKAFENEIHSDHREQFLVEKLYQSAPEDGTFIPELSLVAELGDSKEIVGFALLTKCFLVPSSSSSSVTKGEQTQKEFTDGNSSSSAAATVEEPLLPIVSLCLAPLAIKPQYQKMGIGSVLMREAHKRARELGFTSVVIVGHENYYPRFGYKLMKEFGISVPYEGIPDVNCMAIELVEGCLSLDTRVKGSMVQYAKEFTNY